MQVCALAQVQTLSGVPESNVHSQFPCPLLGDADSLPTPPGPVRIAPTLFVWAGFSSDSRPHYLSAHDVTVTNVIDSSDKLLTPNSLCQRQYEPHIQGLSVCRTMMSPRGQAQKTLLLQRVLRSGAKVKEKNQYVVASAR